MTIKNAIRIGVKIILVALILQLIVAGSAFAFHNVDFSGGSSWYDDDDKGKNAWWEDAWQDDHSPSQDGWFDDSETDDGWWNW